MVHTTTPILLISALLISVRAALLENTEQVEFSLTDMGKCKQTSGPLFIPYEKVDSAYASKACNLLGGELAPVTSTNFNTIASLLLECEGPLSRGWIRAWNGINYGSDCLAMFTGSAIPGGGIDINCLGDFIRPVCISYEDNNNDEEDSLQNVFGAGSEEVVVSVQHKRPAPSLSYEYSISKSSEAPTPSVSVRHARKHKLYKRDEYY